MNNENPRKAARDTGVIWNESPSGIVTMTLHDRSTFAFPKAPRSTSSKELEPGTEGLHPLRQAYVEHDLVGKAVALGLGALMRLSERTHAVGADARFTPAGRADALKQDREWALVNTGLARQQLSEHEVSLIERERELYRVPELGPSDAVGALRDMEVRQWFREQSPERRAAALAELARGETPAMSLAFLRSPVGLGEPEKVAQVSWRTYVERTNREAVEQLQSDQEQYRWGGLVVGRIAKRVQALADAGGYPLFELLAGSNLLMPHGPAAYFDDAELRAHRARWNGAKRAA